MTTVSTALDITGALTWATLAIAATARLGHTRAAWWIRARIAIARQRRHG